ncbi:hypothetical protein OSB04_014312 [Centaurea solstitialis]|uniref:Uncharacterized protein n=1 Tax=Centaurea solstitialis TaxID=347529 RepID=A0AA38W6B2_9ASTR|nr:hypothetical protein OSB04_014312 [Centaurea solstitialis]
MDAMADNCNGKQQLHIAMLPWLAFGHLIPFLELAKLMAAKGHKITFISTPKNIQRLPPIPQTLKPFLTFLQIRLPKLQNLPENAESTKDLPFDKVKFLKIASDGLRQPITDFLKTSSPDWIVYDFFTRANETFGVDEAETVSDTYRLAAAIHGCDAVVIRTSYDFEPDWLKLLNELYRKPVIPAGLLPAEEAAAGEDASWPETKGWLDKHEKGSVVYIAFGTETKPSQYELTQLALGLELCGLPFYWVLIDQRGSTDDVAIDLPRGFEERTRGLGWCVGVGTSVQDCES